MVVPPRRDLQFLENRTIAKGAIDQSPLLIHRHGVNLAAAPKCKPCEITGRLDGCGASNPIFLDCVGASTSKEPHRPHKTTHPAGHYAKQVDHDKVKRLADFFYWIVCLDLSAWAVISGSSVQVAQIWNIVDDQIAGV